MYFDMTTHQTAFKGGYIIDEWKEGSDAIFLVDDAHYLAVALDRQGSDFKPLNMVIGILIGLVSVRTGNNPASTM